MSKKKSYRNYIENQSMRRKNPNIRKIVDGEPVSYWDIEISNAKIVDVLCTINKRR